MKLLRIILFLVVLGWLYIYIAGVFANKSAINRSVRKFVSNSERYDIVGIGPSYIYCTIDPVSIYRESGLKAYDFCSPGQTIEMSYYFAKKALERRTSPKVMIVGATMFVSSADQHMNKDEFIHNGADEYPIGMDKVNMLSACRLPQDMTSYLFTFIKYHSRWKDLKRFNFEVKIDDAVPNYFNGHPCFVKQHTGILKLVEASREDKATIYEGNIEYLKRFKELADAYGTKLLLLTAPRSDTDMLRLRRYRTLYDYAKEIGVDVLDLNPIAQEFGLDLSKDFYDAAHLNVYGAEKASRYLARYLVDKYGLRADLTEEERDSYDKMCDRYDVEKKKAIEKENKKI